MQDSEPTLEDAALAFANRLRKVDGLPPVDEMTPGRIQDSCFCPVAMTAGNGWQVTQQVAARLRHTKGDRGLCTLETPAAVRAFIDAFDAGEYPHLTIGTPAGL